MIKTLPKDGVFFNTLPDQMWLARCTYTCLLFSLRSLLVIPKNWRTGKDLGVFHLFHVLKLGDSNLTPYSIIWDCNFPLSPDLN